MTFHQFCMQHKATPAEREFLALHLVTVRMAKMLKILLRGY